MRNILLGIATSFFLIGCGGGKACDELKSKVCDGDADCIKAFDADMKGGKDEKMSDSDMNAACKIVLDDKDTIEMMKKSMKRKADKANKDEKKEEKKDGEKKE